MIIKLGSTGELVKDIQEIVGIPPDGNFGASTLAAVKKWQSANGLVADGVIGRNTLAKMDLFLLDTDNSLSDAKAEDASGFYTKKAYNTQNGLQISQWYMPKDEYKSGPIDAQWVFLHHTAGWHNPYNVVKQWDADKSGQISTEFVIGGQSIRANDNAYDGDVVQAFPHGNWGYHLGKNGSQTMHTNSIGIEVCNFGYIKNGKTYAGTQAAESQIVTLSKPFRGYKQWHRYSDKQLKNLKLLLEFIATRDSIDIRKGLPELIKTKGAAAFEFNESVYYGRIKGLWNHTNVRKDKFDMFPQQELLDMLLSL